MSVDDQDGRVVVSMPWKRAELILLLEELSDKDKQLRLWVMHEDFPSASGIDEIFHFFFDDSDLGDNPWTEVGRVLKSQAEAKIIKCLTGALCDLFQRLGDAPSDVFMSDPAWSSLMGIARASLKLLLENDGRAGVA